MRYAVIDAEKRVTNVIEAEIGLELEGMQVVMDAERVSAIGMSYAEGMFKSAWECMSADEQRAETLARINRETQARIEAGFSYVVDGETCRISYDAHDQQNFADAVNGILLAKTGLADMPKAIEWNTHTAEGMVRRTFSPDGFLALHAAALSHKAKELEAGRARKAAVETDAARDGGKEQAQT